MKWMKAARARAWFVSRWRVLGRRGEPPAHEQVEFRKVLDEVWEEKDWVMLRAGALERSWQADGEPLS